MDDHHFNLHFFKKKKKFLHFSQPLPPKVFNRKKRNKKKRKTKALVSPLVAPVSIQTVEGP
jgi:hypothetical protein